MANSIPTWCWYCKQQIPSQAEVCPFCSKPLNDAKRVVRCNTCGKFLLMASGRCSQCGTPLPTAAPPPMPQQPFPEQPPAPPVSPEQPPAPDEAPAFPQEQPPAADMPSETGEAPLNEELGGLGAMPEMPDGAPAGEAPMPPMPDDPGMQETLRALEQLEAQENASASGRGSSGRKIMIIGIIVAAVALIALAVVFFLTRPKPEKEPEPEAPVVCADGEHVWVEADCEHPRTCSVCGATEGEPLGHHFEGNVCTVCGAFKKPFYFTDPDCARDGSTVVFWGCVQNCTGLGVKDLQLKLSLYDKDMNVVAEETGPAVEDGGSMTPLEAIQWEMRYDDTGLKWKYWRIAAVDYTPEEP
ncbi:MAG: hypothetical protein E7422_08255 [Ruminococcaceae bacterium]|jgi:hypothetical protein|nr:hypothetical protein [Oscillospiraceae bacterium]